MPTYQAIAMPATHQVLTSGVRMRGWMLAEALGRAYLRAIDSAVRDAGMIVVWVEAIADVATENSTSQDQPPITSSARKAKTNSSSSALSGRNWRARRRPRRRTRPTRR